MRRADREALQAAARASEAAELLEQLAPLTADLGERGYLEGLAAGFRDGSRAAPEPAYLARLRSALVISSEEPEPEEEALAEELAAGLAALCAGRSLTLRQLAQKIEPRELARQLASEVIEARASRSSSESEGARMSELERARERAWRELRRARADFERGRLEEYVLSRAELRYARLYPGAGRAPAVRSK